MIKWQDTSSWGKKDTEEEKATPKKWETQIGIFRLVVHRSYLYDPKAWFVTSYPAVLTAVELMSEDPDEAKCQAVTTLECLLLDAIATINKERSGG